MNLVKAADDLKNLSDQQLMSAGQNPVAVPPYLVLAEMKRREQLRAEYAKAQQGQQQQQPVIQQVAQNLVQGQPQQPQQPQPQGQGIMQTMPQGAVGMAGGGHVARYADGGKGSGSMDLGPYQAIIDQLNSMRSAAPREATSSSPLTSEEFYKLYQFPNVQDKMAVAESMLGRPDYSQYQEFLNRQRQEAESRKVRLGDALIAAGAAMASNRDPRVGIANILAQGIGAGSEAYRSAQERKKKDVQAAMMADMALKNIMQQDRAKQVQLASELYGQERGQKIAEAQTLEANRRALEEKRDRARTESERRNAEIELQKLRVLQAFVTAKERAQQARDIASMRIGASSGRPMSQRERANEEASSLIQDALSQAQTYAYESAQERKAKGLSELDPYEVAIKNLRNPAYFKGYSDTARQLAASALISEMTKMKAIENNRRSLALKEGKAAAPGIAQLIQGSQQSRMPFSQQEQALAEQFGEAIP